jgi:hypothetical protein
MHHNRVGRAEDHSLYAIDTMCLPMGLSRSATMSIRLTDGSPRFVPVTWNVTCISEEIASLIDRPVLDKSSVLSGG